MSTSNTPMGPVLPEPVTIGLRALVPSVVRTLVPLIVAGVVRLGIAETSLDTAWLETALTVVITAFYYIVIRVLEQSWDKIGWLLGYPVSPTYVKGVVLAATAVDTTPTTTTVIETDEDPETI